MRILSGLAFLALAATAEAQSPLSLNWNGTSFVGGNGGNIGNAVFFDLNVTQTITITQLDLNCYQDNPAPPALPTPPIGTIGSVNIFLGPTTYVGNETNLSLWTTVATASLTTMAPLQPTPALVSSGFTLGPGSYGVCLDSVGFRLGYSNPGNQAGAATAEVSIAAGAAQNVQFAAPTFSPRLANVRIHYTHGGTPIAVAAWQPYGRGCYGRWTSFYEHWGNPANQDLTNTTMRLTFAGTFYSVSSVPQAWFTPASAALPVSGLASFPQATAFPVLYPQGGTVQFTNTLDIVDDGFVSPVAAAPDSTPTVLEYLNGVPRWCPHWKNQDISVAGGSIHYDVDPNGQAFYVTWLNISDPVAFSTARSNYQVAFFINGDIEYRYQTMSVGGGGSTQVIVGWTHGNGALDRGPMDISASLPFVTDPVDNPPLALGLNVRPQLGSLVSFDISAIPQSTLAATWLFSFAQLTPGFDLGPLGAGGCFAHLPYTTAINGNAALPPYAGNGASAVLPIPNNPVFNGVLLFAQGATLTPGFNQLGLLSSNGVRLVVGSL